VEVKDGATVVGKYEYDGLTRRVKRHLDSDSPGSPDGIDTYVHYLYNAAWQILETRDTATESDQPENLQPDYQYVWSGRYIDAPILRDENTDQDSLCDDARLYYLTDANFNVTTLTDTSGDAVERYVYDPYGSATIYDATWSNTRRTSSYDNTVLYTGREFDPETGMYCYRDRYYCSHLGRFLSRDPIGFEGGDINIYRYVNNRPTLLVDPSGLQRWLAETGWEKNDIEYDATTGNDATDGLLEWVVSQWVNSRGYPKLRVIPYRLIRRCPDGYSALPATSVRPIHQKNTFTGVRWVYMYKTGNRVRAEGFKTLADALERAAEVKKQGGSSIWGPKKVKVTIKHEKRVIQYSGPCVKCPW